MPEADRSTDELFEAAVKTHTRRLLAIARSIIGTRASAEDVVQQALMNLYRHRARYDWNEPGGLLRRSVVNESLRILRQPRMHVVGEEHPGRSESPMQDMMDREMVDKVRGAIGRLPDNYRAALVLCEYEQLPYSEIAQALGASIPQVKTWLHRGRRQLAQMLAGYAGEELVRQPSHR